jgi:hypothetical protein
MIRAVQSVRMIAIAIALTGGLGSSLSVIIGMALAQEADVTTPSPFDSETESGPVITSTNVPYTDFSFVRDIAYARIITKSPVSVYSHPLDIDHGLPPTRTIEPGFMFVSLEQRDPITFSNGLWYEINKNEFVRAEVLTYYTPSTFHGVQLDTQPTRPFGWIIRRTPIFSAPVDAPTPTDMFGWPVARQMALPDQAFLPRYQQVTIYETSYAGDWGWHRIGEEKWVHLYDVGKIQVTARPSRIPAGERWIMVNLFDQTLAAYNEHDQMVYATLISTGLQVDGWRTPPGIYRVHTKVLMDKMAGGGKSDRYLLEDVHATVYFHQSYAFHAAYWHDDFGRYKSHGCVNMAPVDAEWLYNWSTPIVAPQAARTRATGDNPGTWVWIYDPHDDLVFSEG